ARRRLPAQPRQRDARSGSRLALRVPPDDRGGVLMPARRTHSRGWRWFKRGALGLVAFLAVAIGAAVLAMHTRWGRGMLRAQVEQRLKATFTGGASVRAVEGTPLGKLTLYDLVINGPDKRPAISIGQVTVGVGLLPLLSHQARILGVAAQDVDVDLRRGSDGQLEIGHLLRPGPSSDWSVTLPSVELRRVHVRFDTGSEVLNVHRLALDARANIPHGGPIDASLELLAGRVRERAGAELNLRTALHSDEGGLSMPYLYARAGDVSVIGTGVTVAKPAEG